MNGHVAGNGVAKCICSSEFEIDVWKALEAHCIAGAW